MNGKINRFNDKDSKDEKEVLDKVDNLLKSKKWVYSHNWAPNEVEIINKYMFLTAKTVVYLINLSAEDF